ncbi:hypothetical protein K450DRAFT_267942 [Umbelopsis ramanniana AG]|uniref:BZIP domain-containing protein n=1 Tax=Umbelopsis ramanniana AG TaxID=1314678 RepID=A0AAD5HGU6_UMBRA|nr:uncharacterized protein K450DRAFT_267942 [Umbelopsis ramanniana AG]KAI8583937.1 hypothetical protein K450DRAFT_267942 [Umbelopsis ramanniana AG]
MSIHAITTHDDERNHAHANTSSHNNTLEPDNIYSPRQVDGHMSTMSDSLPPWDTSDGFRRYSSAAESSTSNQDNSPASTPSVTQMTSSSPSATRYAQDIPLSLAERRQRNKAASAKYRAKKHAVTAQMSSKIDELTASNAQLQRELDDAHMENRKLKDRCEDLRRQLGAKYHGMLDSPQDGKKRKGLEGTRTTSTSAPPNLPSRSKSIKSKSKK